MRRFFHVSIIGAFTLVLATTLALPAYAADDKNWIESILGQPFIPKECAGEPSTDVNDCGLDQVLQVIVNASRLMIAFAGSAALLVVVYGGTMWIIAAGNSEKIEKGKTAMASAAIGIAIILGAWLIVNFTILAITKGRVGGDATIFGDTQKWFSPPSSTDGTGSNGAIDREFKPTD